MNKLEARKILLKLYKETGSILQTAKKLSCSRNTVRKFVKRFLSNQSLEDLSKVPKHFPKITNPEIESLVEKRRKETNFGRIRLAHYILAKDKIKISPHTIRHILRRKKLHKQMTKRTVFKAVRFYDYDKLSPLEVLQVDIKEILDIKTLPKTVYFHIKRTKLPTYQFTAICVKTRMKFICYGFQKDFSNGICFLQTVISWIRSFGFNHRIFLQSDWDVAFGGTSIKKLFKLQRTVFEPLNSQILRIRKRNWKDNSIVERTHRTDDEEFYIPHIAKINSLDALFEFALKYNYSFNTLRPHYGKYMYGLTPFEKLKALKPNISETFAAFPPLLLDFISTKEPFIFDKSGHNLLAYYLFHRLLP